MPDFTRRINEPEMMDDLLGGGPDLQQALRELDTINYALGGNYVTLSGVSRLSDSIEGQGPLHIADVGCGSGDMLQRIRGLLDKRRTDAVLTGFDANPHVVRYAQEHTPPLCRIQYEAINIFSDEFQRRTFDIVVGTLFFHHFRDEELVEFLKTMRAQVRVGIIINDIHRHWFSYYAIKWLTRLFSKSVMVKHDAPLSVLRAFKKRELHEILKKAGILDYELKWRWAFRWQVIVPATKETRQT